ncbi:hypothetical protein VNO78_21860 [Psophocarpus tetragonolobus]|uniref:SANTA domain-containing protein n=1 Tax=Psophocarpus tetragonolobus TaxID=3891 RepID=A0AAN9XIN7_PSOTE
MADCTSTATPSNDTESCYFQRTFTLYDWWLIKAQDDFQGKRLAVAGVSSRKNEAMRVFVSAPVVKRHDVFSLETADGKCVIISGFINEKRTLENGFTPEVFNCFLYGFPPNWESYALDCFREESTTGTDLGAAAPHNVSACCPEILSDGVEDSISNSLASQKEAPGDLEKSFCINERNLSKEMSGVNVACSSGGKRRSARLHDINVCKQKKQIVSGGLPKHIHNEENSTSVALENSDAERRKSSATPIQSQLRSEYANDACLETQKEAPGDLEKSFCINERNLPKEMGGVNVACSSGGKRRSARLHDIKVCKQKKQIVAGGLPNHLRNEENSSSVALENSDAERLKSPATPIQSQLRSVENPIPTSSASREEAPGDHEKSSHGGPPKHPDNENFASLSLENCDVEGLKSSPATPIQSKSRRQRTSHEQPVKKSASRISSTLSPKTDGCYKKKRVTIETKQNILIGSPQSLSFRKSRSGRLLLPPLEFWRNQIPIYNADHELTEIQDCASLI